MKNVALIGCGLIGDKRREALTGAQIIACADTDFARAKTLAEKIGQHCYATANWLDAVQSSDVDIVLVATPHVSLPEIALAAIKAGKHVLIEKPAARFADELLPLIAAAKENNVCVRVGFNHRYHRAFQQARRLIDEGAIGELMFVRARYGHGGRIGYEQEWRARPEISGGGEMIDQGMHLIDLSRWFLGEFSDIQGHAETCFWNMPVDDNSFMLLRTPNKKTAFLHASCTEWKNTFSFEIYGKKGKLEINGLGGSYGLERLSFYRMLPQMGPPETSTWEYPMADNSWQLEFAEFMTDIQQQRTPQPGLQDAYQALKIVEHIARSSGYDYYP
jgi:predicted dehydrogenase